MRRTSTDIPAADWFTSSYSNDQGGACVEAARLWFTSSYSNAQGGDCVEAARVWFTSSYSNDQGGDCVEGARCCGGAMAIRDTKDRSGPSFLFPAAAWTPFLAAVTDGRLEP